MTKDFMVLVTGTTSLSIAEIWPDGDAPENPTAEDVAAVMRLYDRGEVVEEWALIEDCDVEVYGARHSPFYTVVWEATPRTSGQDEVSVSVCSRTA